MKICNCYDETEIQASNLWNPLIIKRCRGTKECDECLCEGDRTKCDFYPEVREKALKESFPQLQMTDIVEVGNITELIYFLDDEYAQFDGKVYPNEDDTLEEDRISKVWRRIGDDYICIFKREV